MSDKKYCAISLIITPEEITSVQELVVEDGGKLTIVPLVRFAVGSPESLKQQVLNQIATLMDSLD